MSDSIEVIPGMAHIAVGPASLPEGFTEEGEMEGFTPGPWRECGHDRGGCQCGQVWSVAADCPVATVESGEWGDEYPAVREVDGKCEAYMERIGYGIVPEDAARANARLIAAAPDLLSALRLCEAVLTRQKWIEGGPDPEAIAMTAARAAIARAQREDGDA